MLMFTGADVGETIERIVRILRESVGLMDIIRKQHKDSRRSKATLARNKDAQDLMRSAADEIAATFDSGNNYSGQSYQATDDIIRMRLTAIADNLWSEVLREIYVVKDNQDAVLEVETLISDISMYRDQVLGMIEDIKSAVDPLVYYQQRTPYSHPILETVQEVVTPGPAIDGLETLQRNLSTHNLETTSTSNVTTMRSQLSTLTKRYKDRARHVKRPVNSALESIRVRRERVIQDTTMKEITDLLDSGMLYSSNKKLTAPIDAEKLKAIAEKLTLDASSRPETNQEGVNDESREHNQDQVHSAAQSPKRKEDEERTRQAIKERKLKQMMGLASAQGTPEVKEAKVLDEASTMPQIPREIEESLDQQRPIFNESNEQSKSKAFKVCSEAHDQTLDLSREPKIPYLGLPTPRVEDFLDRKLPELPTEQEVPPLSKISPKAQNSDETGSDKRSKKTRKGHKVPTTRNPPPAPTRPPPNTPVTPKDSPKSPKLTATTTEVPDTTEKSSGEIKMSPRIHQDVLNTYTQSSKNVKVDTLQGPKLFNKSTETMVTPLEATIRDVAGEDAKIDEIMRTYAHGEVEVEEMEGNTNSEEAKASEDAEAQRMLRQDRKSFITLHSLPSPGYSFVDVPVILDTGSVMQDTNTSNKRFGFVCHDPGTPPLSTGIDSITNSSKYSTPELQSGFPFAFDKPLPRPPLTKGGPSVDPLRLPSYYTGKYDAEIAETVSPDQQHYGPVKIPLERMPNVPDVSPISETQSSINQTKYTVSPILEQTASSLSTSTNRYDKELPPSPMVSPNLDSRLSTPDRSTSQATTRSRSSSNASMITPLSSAHSSPRFRSTKFSPRQSPSSRFASRSPSPMQTPSLYRAGTHPLPSLGSEKMTPPPPPPRSASRPTFGMKPTRANGYLGLCKGAWQLRSDPKGSASFSSKALGLYGRRPAYKCKHCAFDGTCLSDVGSASLDPLHSGRVYMDEATGIRYKWMFLAKCHAKTKVVASRSQSGAFGCVFCVEEGKGTGVYGSVGALMRHVGEQHRMMRWDIALRNRVVLGSETGMNDAWDLVLPDT